jgi:hypothetical protein
MQHGPAVSELGPGALVAQGLGAAPCPLVPPCTRIGQKLVLGRKDSNLRMADPKSAALPLGDSPVASAADPTEP